MMKKGEYYGKILRKWLRVVFNQEKFLRNATEMVRAYASFAEENKVPFFLISGEVDTMATVGHKSGKEHTKLVQDTGKALIAEARKVYSGKIIIGLAGISETQEDMPYYPFEGADILCFSKYAEEGDIEKSIMQIKRKAENMEGIAQQAGIKEVTLCEVGFILKGLNLNITINTVGKFIEQYEQNRQLYLGESFQKEEAEFYRKLITEVGPQLSGISVPVSIDEGAFSMKGRLAEKEVAEGFAEWK